MEEVQEGRDGTSDGELGRSQGRLVEGGNVEFET